MFEMLESENVIKSAERKIITAALELQEKTAEQVMTKIDDVYMLEINTLLGHKTLREIYSKGFSRVPIYEKTKDNIVGILMSRDLILINPDKQLITLKQMSSIIIKDVIAVGNKDKLEPLLGYFKDGLTHIGIVTKFMIDEGGKQNSLEKAHSWTGEPVKKVVGIVTLEDIIEEIISDEIHDEYEIGEEKQNR
jgi:metal transporter CNNM